MYTYFGTQSNVYSVVVESTPLDSLPWMVWDCLFDPTILHKRLDVGPNIIESPGLSSIRRQWQKWTWIFTITKKQRKIVTKQKNLQQTFLLSNLFQMCFPCLEVHSFLAVFFSCNRKHYCLGFTVCVVSSSSVETLFFF